MFVLGAKVETKNNRKGKIIETNEYLGERYAKIYCSLDGKIEWYNEKQLLLA